MIVLFAFLFLVRVFIIAYDKNLNNQNNQEKARTVIATAGLDHRTSGEGGFSC
jgi:hypothetical protein